MAHTDEKTETERTVKERLEAMIMSKAYNSLEHALDAYCNSDLADNEKKMQIDAFRSEVEKLQVAAQGVPLDQRRLDELIKISLFIREDLAVSSTR